MTSTPRDNNQETAIAGVLNTDGATATPVQSDPTIHAVKIHDASTGAVTARSDAHRDDNSTPTMLAASSADGTPVELAVNSSGQLLVQST
jgi:hypothetical protein